jgi:hypothetical protein
LYRSNQPTHFSSSLTGDARTNQDYDGVSYSSVFQDEQTLDFPQPLVENNPGIGFPDVQTLYNSSLPDDITPFHPSTSSHQSSIVASRPTADQDNTFISSDCQELCHDIDYALAVVRSSSEVDDRKPSYRSLNNNNVEEPTQAMANANQPQDDDIPTTPVKSKAKDESQQASSSSIISSLFKNS